MYISHKSNVLQSISETEWMCRLLVKGLNKREYYAWIATVTSGDPPVVDYSGETGYTIVECTDENVLERLNQLGDYVNINRAPDEALVYNIKWSDSKVDGSHFSGDDTAKTARLVADEWTRIRTERTRLLAETDYMGYSDMTMNDAWKVYRQTLRNIPSVQSSKTTYASITWPTKP